MRLLFCGAGKGSWQMRGLQLGRALEAVLGPGSVRMTSNPTEADYRWADRIILIKKMAFGFAPRARKWDRPIIWDALDCWIQPGEAGLDESAALSLLQSHLATVKPDLMIGATEAMARAGRRLGQASVSLSHHCWTGLTPTPARSQISVVAYDGNPNALGHWEHDLRRACQARGWRFVLNPSNLASVDLLVALRDTRWDGWITRQWKSGVKLVNAICAGRPVITQPCAAFDEVQPIGTVIDDRRSLGEALDAWQDAASRQAVVTASQTRAAGFTVEALAHTYLGLLQEEPVAWVA